MNSVDPQGRATVLVTGASSGIGASISQLFSEKGYHVVLAARSLEKLKHVQKNCPKPTTLLTFDLHDVEKSFHEIKSLQEKLPPIEILINNAGIFQTGAFEAVSNESWYEQFEVNFFSAVKLTRFLWPSFKKNRKGSILNISSSLGIKPSPGTSAYSASKAAMNNWTMNLAQEGEGFNIRANAICPGIIDTPIHGFHKLEKEEKSKQAESIHQMQLLKALGEPQDIARAAFFLASDESKWTTGSILTIDGGISLK